MATMLHQSNGGMRVSGDDSIRLPASGCSVCAGRPCRVPTACEVAEPAASRIRINAFACFGAIAGLAATAAWVQALGLLN